MLVDVHEARLVGYRIIPEDLWRRAGRRDVQHGVLRGKAVSGERAGQASVGTGEGGGGVGGGGGGDGGELEGREKRGWTGSRSRTGGANMDGPGGQ